MRIAAVAVLALALSAMVLPGIATAAPRTEIQVGNSLGADIEFSIYSEVNASCNGGSIRLKAGDATQVVCVRVNINKDSTRMTMVLRAEQYRNNPMCIIAFSQEKPGDKFTAVTRKGNCTVERGPYGLEATVR